MDAALRGRGGTGNVYIKGRLSTVGKNPTPTHPQVGVGGIYTQDIEAVGYIISDAGYYGPHKDIAENYISQMELNSGDVVCLEAGTDMVIRSEIPDDPMVLGIVSSKPAFTLNSNLSRKNDIEKIYPIALSGRVPCKVIDEGGPIKRGDLLTSSSTSGHAMKAKPVRVGDQEIFRQGTIIGKALEPLESGKGLIDVFVFLT